MANEIIVRLKALVGDQHVIESPLEMAGFLKGSGRPLAVVLPGQTSEVSEIVRLANQLALKLNVGGAVVDSKNLDGGIALVMKRMNRLLEIDRENLVALVEPGMAHSEFIQKVAEEKLYFPVDPYIAATASIGGCFAVGDADAKSFQYGPARTYLLGFEMVLPTGEILEIGNKCIKNVAGYDFIHLAVGSKATLGIFTRLLVKLLPPPQARASVLAIFPGLRSAAAPLETIIRRNIHPTRASVLSQPLADAILPGCGGDLVLLDFEGFRESTKALTQEVAAVFTLAGGSGVTVVEDGELHAELWAKWLVVKGNLNCGYTSQTIDFSIGPLKLIQTLDALEKAAGGFARLAGVNIEALAGNLRVVLPADTTPEDKAALTDKINALAIAGGGGIAGCPGVNLACRYYRDPEMWAAISGLLQSVRGSFDPRGILAPGVNFT
jgi:glycolate oxidase